MMSCGRSRSAPPSDAAAAPQRLEQRIAEAERQQVLHGLLAQVVVDAEYLRLGEDRAHVRVDGGGGLQVLPEGLFQHHA